jgi:hypothetical protein
MAGGNFLYKSAFPGFDCAISPFGPHTSISCLTKIITVQPSSSIIPPGVRNLRCHHCKVININVGMHPLGPPPGQSGYYPGPQPPQQAYQYQGSAGQPGYQPQPQLQPQPIYVYVWMFRPGAGVINHCIYSCSQQPPQQKNDDFCTACLTGVCLCCALEGGWFRFLHLHRVLRDLAALCNCLF